MRVTPQLTILDTVFICNAEGGQNIPSVIFNGADYIVSFWDARENKGVVASRVSPQGIVMDTGYTIDQGNNYPVAVRGSGQTLILWSREFDAVCGRFVDDQALPQDTVMRIAAISAAAARPAAAFDGTDYLVVWPDFGATGTLDIFGRLLRGGMPIDTPMILVQELVAENNPDLVFDGENYFLVWENGPGQIRGMFLDQAGKPITGPMVISDSVFHLRGHPAAAAGLGYRSCFWSENLSDYDIYGMIEQDIGIKDHDAGWPRAMTAAPNPFANAIRFTLHDSGCLIKTLRVRIYSATGCLVKDMSFRSSGIINSVFWDGTDEKGCSVAGGVYFARLSDAGTDVTVKIVKIR